MDPDAVWKMLIETLQDLKKWPESKECRAHAIDCLAVLATWLRHGGFPPQLDEENVWRRGSSRGGDSPHVNSPGLPATGRQRHGLPMMPLAGGLKH